MPILVLNAGSSSLKFSLFGAGLRLLAGGAADWAGDPPRYEFTPAGGATARADGAARSHGQTVQRLLRDLRHASPPVLSHLHDISAVGHRIVHGGEKFTAPVRVTPAVTAALNELTPLAPLHNPPSLAALAAAQAELPGAAHVAVFDTAFHATLPPAARTYAVPWEWTAQWGLRRFGFHGLSHAYCAGRAAELLGPGRARRVVVCHLGHGASLAAVRDGRSVDTTMGFTPLEGLVMATRAGSIDPGMLLEVQKQHGLSADQVEAALWRESGLLGVSGVSADLRAVLAAADTGSERAKLAVGVYVYSIRRHLGAMLAALGGADAVVFTAGVGEHSAVVRSAVCRELEGLGLVLDEAANAACKPDADVAAAGSPVRILVVATREDLMIAREVERVLSPGGGGKS